KPLFALESGDTTLILQYDLEGDNIGFIGLPGAVAVAAPVVAPAPPQTLPEVAAQPAPPTAPPPPPAVEAAKPAPVLQVVEPQVPRAAKPATPAARPAAAAARRAKSRSAVVHGGHKSCSTPSASYSHWRSYEIRETTCDRRLRAGAGCGLCLCRQASERPGLQHPGQEQRRLSDTHRGGGE